MINSPGLHFKVVTGPPRIKKKIKSVTMGRRKEEDGLVVDDDVDDVTAFWILLDLQ
jgi:hypothetical protein